MLVLSRKKGEAVMVGDDVAITVLAIQGNQVRIGVSAPRSVPVHREEIYIRIAAEREELQQSLEVAGAQASLLT